MIKEGGGRRGRWGEQAAGASVDGSKGAGQGIRVLGMCQYSTKRCSFFFALSRPLMFYMAGGRWFLYSNIYPEKDVTASGMLLLSGGWFTTLILIKILTRIHIIFMRVHYSCTRRYRNLLLLLRKIFISRNIRANLTHFNSLVEQNIINHLFILHAKHVENFFSC